MALVGIPLVELVPASGPLVAFLMVTIWVNGPLAPFMPATYEPILMLFGRLYPPLLVATIGMAGTLWIEFLNYHLYRRVLALEVFQPALEKPLVKRIVRLFNRAPFFTIWLCSWSILPYWTVRFLSPIAEYPVGKQLVATLLGRFPRLWFFAALGLFWHVSNRLLTAVAATGIVLAIGIWIYKRFGKSGGGEAALAAEPETESAGR